MKTWVAALAHIGVATLQATAGVAFFDAKDPNGVLANTAVQALVQAVLVILQAWIARANSNTDPNGQKLVEASPGKFVTSQK